MATIDSVKLPDNSTYDVTDNHSGYAKKVTSATTDDLASLTATGDLADSGKKLSDLVLKSDVKDVLNSTSVTDPLSANQGRLIADNLAANENVYGAKNLIPFPYEGGMSYTFRGVTYTVSDKGIITTANTATNDGWYVLALNIILAPGTYTIKGCPSGGSADTYRLTVRVTRSGGTTNYYYDIGEGYTFAFNEGDSLNVTLNVGNGTDMDGLTFYPMLCDARVIDPTFAPFAKTNKQLTEDSIVKNISNQITAGTNITINTTSYIKYGKIRELYVNLTATSSIATWATLLSGLDSAPLPVWGTLYSNDGNINEYFVYVESGNIIVRTGFPAGDYALHLLYISN